MRRTGRALVTLLTILSFGWLTPFQTMGQGGGGNQTEVQVQASVSESTVEVGDRVALKVEVSGKDFNNISRPSLPELPGFRLVSNTPSTSRSYRFVNGQSSVSYSYTYYMVAEEPGNHVIPPISLAVDGDNRQTGPLSMTVHKRTGGSGISGDGSDSGSNDENIFLEMEVNSRNPVPGEQILASVALYFRDDIQVTSYQPVPGWKAEGFWKERLETRRPETEAVIRDGVRYKKAELVEYALFPTKSGNLSLSSYKVALAIRTRTSGRDPFSSFFGSRQKRIELKTEPINIEVKSLPPLEDARYIGAVGSFEVNRSINTTEAEVGQTVELTTRINGTGNIPLISKPDYEIPASFETYAPQQSSNIDNDGKAIKGEKTFTDILIPRKTGTFTIPAEKVAYYNTRTQDYKMKYLPAIDITVTRSAETIAASRTGDLPIQPVSGLVRWDTPSQTILIYQWWFWAALGLPLLMLLLGYWQRSYREKLLNDRNFARSEQAWDKAKQRLGEVKRLSRDKKTKEVYSKLHTLLNAYIGDKLGLPEAGVSDDTYIRELTSAGSDEQLIKKVRQILEKCATIRYAPNPDDRHLQRDVERTEEIIKQLKKEL